MQTLFSLKHVISGRIEDFQNLSAGLDKCQKSLTEYLNSKRSVFPRFNFISDDELLGVLGNSDPSVIQQYIGKMFDNLGKMRFGVDSQDRTVITTFISCEGEEMELRSTVVAEGKIEEWMGAALKEMQISNKFLTKKAIYDYGQVKIALVFSYIIIMQLHEFNKLLCFFLIR